MIFFCPKRLHDFFDPRDCVIILSREIAFFFVPRGCMRFICRERWYHFFCPLRLLHFLFVRVLVWFFLCPERLSDLFFVSRGCVICFCPKRLRDFLSQEVRCFFCPESLPDFFFVQRGCVIFFWSQKVEWIFFCLRMLRVFFVKTACLCLEVPKFRSSKVPKFPWSSFR